MLRTDAAVYCAMERTVLPRDEMLDRKIFILPLQLRQHGMERNIVRGAIAVKKYCRCAAAGARDGNEWHYAYPAGHKDARCLGILRIKIAQRLRKQDFFSPFPSTECLLWYRTSLQARLPEGKY